MKVDNGLPGKAVVGSIQNLTRSAEVDITSVRVAPFPSTPTTTTYHGQTFARTQTSGKILVTPDAKGWRMPSGYRKFVGLAVMQPFDYEYELSSSLWRRYGTTPLDFSVGPGSNLLYWGTTLSGGFYLPDVNANMIHHAETECLANLKNGAFNLAADLVESPQTVDLIATLSMRVMYAWKSTSIRDYKTAAKILFGNHGWYNLDLSIKDQWLSWQYGWRPLLQDIYDGCELVRNGLKSGSFCYARKRVTEDYGLPPNPGNKSTWLVQGESLVGCEVALWADVSAPWLAMVESLGFINPLALAWEELPFSFIIDWFAPVGTFLAALTAPIGIRFLSGTRTTKSWMSIDVQCVIESPAYGDLPRVKFRNISMLREPYSNFPVPMLYVKSPYSSTHLENALALLNVRSR